MDVAEDLAVRRMDTRNFRAFDSGVRKDKVGVEGEWREVIRVTISDAWVRVSCLRDDARVLVIISGISGKK
jgi:hypothetical protein